MWRGASNVVMAAPFASGWLLRIAAPGDPGALAIIVSFVEAGLASLGGFLGGDSTSTRRM
ncbi:MAG TPA: hypothetical protein VFJ72_14480 [Rubrobacteraceae bacterium]|nr:hypothetical protein [Rubrobacteraceae bacterium]